MKNLIPLALFLLLNATSAFAQDVFCVDSQDSDKIVELVVEGGRVVGANYSNQDHGTFDDHALQPADYTFNGSTLTYAGDVYGCQ